MWLEKNAIRDDADFALIFQDEMEIHRHPDLMRMWAAVGQQTKAPAPGQNEQKVIYRGVDRNVGKLIYTVADTEAGMEFLAFLVLLLACYTRHKIVVMCDNGPVHVTKTAHEWLAEYRAQLEVFWLPSYSLSLNLIKRQQCM